LRLGGEASYDAGRIANKASASREDVRNTAVPNSSPINQSIDSIRKLQTNSIAVDMLTLKSQDKSRAEKNVDAIKVQHHQFPHSSRKLFQ
jgi:hypothetical protein